MVSTKFSIQCNLSYNKTYPKGWKVGKTYLGTRGKLKEDIGGVVDKMVLAHAGDEVASNCIPRYACSPRTSECILQFSSADSRLIDRGNANVNSNLDNDVRLG